MSDIVPPTAPLSKALADFAQQLGDDLPAAFELQPGSVLLAADAGDHPLPAQAVAVRWTVDAGEAALVVVVTEDSAAQLRSGPPEQDLVGALTPRITAALWSLAPIFGDRTPTLTDGEEVAATDALADGPGDGVSITLEDMGTHQVTVGLRMVVGDDLLASGTDGFEQGFDEDYEAAYDDPLLERPQPTAPVSPQGPAPVSGTPLTTGPAGEVQPGIPLPDQAAAQHIPTAPLRGAVQTPGAAPAAEAHPADFASFDQLTTLPGAGHSMSMLSDVEMGVTAELGRTRLTVREVLGLSPGSIIELDRAAGSPVDVVVNGTLIARGEVVVIDEEFGVRITEIIGMSETAQSLPLQVAQ